MGSGKKRLDFVDVAKGIGILSIVAWHIGLASNVLGPIAPTYHVPIFFLVAGFFLSTKTSVPKFAVDKARRLLVPYVVTCAVMGGILLAMGAAGIDIAAHSIWPNMQNFFGSAAYAMGCPPNPEGIGWIGAIWFLPALFVAMLETRILIGLPVSLDAKVALSAVLAYLSIFVRQRLEAQGIFVPFDVLSGLCGGLYVMLGHAYRQLGLIEQSPHPISTLVMAAVATVGSMIYGLSVALVVPFMSHGLTSLVVSLFACQVVLEVSKLIAKAPESLPCKAMVFLGQTSLTTMCIHLVFLDFRFHEIVTQMLPADMIGAADIVDFAIQMVSAIAFALLWRRVRNLFARPATAHTPHRRLAKSVAPEAGN